jgi:hypothetical protein
VYDPQTNDLILANEEEAKRLEREGYMRFPMKDLKKLKGIQREPAVKKRIELATKLSRKTSAQRKHQKNKKQARKIQRKGGS